MDAEPRRATADPPNRADRPSRTVAPYGSWRSPIRVEDIVDGAIRLSEPWVDGDDVYWIEGRPAEGGRSVLVRREPDGTTIDRDAAAIQRPHPRPRVRRRRRTPSAGGTSLFSTFARRTAVPARPGRDRRSPSRRTGRIATPTCASTPARRRFLAVREDHSGDRRADRRDRRRAPRRRARPRGPRPPARTSSPRRGCRRTATGSPGSSGTTRTCRGTRRGCGWRRSRDDGSLGAERSRGRRRRRVDRPARVVARRRAPFRQRPDRLVEPVPAGRGPDGSSRSRRLEAEFADPAWVFGRSSYAFLAGRLDRRGRPGATVAIGCSTSRRAISSARSTRRSPRSARSVSAAAGVVANRRARPGAVRWSCARPRDARDGRGRSRQLASIALDPAYISEPEPITFPTCRWTHGARALLSRRSTRTSEAPDGERPPLVVLSHGGPTSSASTALDLTKQFLTAAASRSSTSTTAAAPATAARTARCSTGQWGVVDVDDCVGGGRFLVDRGDVDRDRLAIEGGSAGGYTTLAALAFTRRVRCRDQPVRRRRPRALARHTHKFESRYMDRLVGPYPAGRDAYRERSPIHHLDRIRARCSSCRASTTRSCRRSRPSSIVAAALAARRHPVRLPRVRGRGPRLPRRGRPSGARSRRSSSFLGQVFGFDAGRRDRTGRADRQAIAAGA